MGYQASCKQFLKVSIIAYDHYLKSQFTALKTF